MSDKKINPREVFEKLCDEAGNVSSFVSVVVDEKGLVSIGSMSLEQEDVIDMLENAADYLRDKWDLAGVDMTDEFTAEAEPYAVAPTHDGNKTVH